MIEVHTLAAGIDYAAEVQRALEHNRHYCDRHGYPYHVHRDTPPTRPPAWYKIPIIREALSRGQWAAWIDADALILDQARPIEDFLDPTADLTFSPGQQEINTGVWIASPRPWTLDFLQAVWDDPTWNTPGRVLWEQSRVVGLYRANAMDCQAHVRLVDRRDFQDGRFIRHLSGLNRFKGPGHLKAAIDETLDHP